MAPMNVEENIRQDAIQLISMVPNVKEWIDRHTQRSKGQFTRSDLEEAYSATKRAVWNCILKDVHEATFPQTGVRPDSFCTGLGATTNTHQHHAVMYTGSPFSHTCRSV